MQSSLMRTIPYIEARLPSHLGKKQNPKTISLQLSGTTADRGAALGIANYWNGSSSQLSYSHYVVDEELMFQCVPDSRRLTERGIVRINVCGEPVTDGSLWTGTQKFDVFHNVVGLVAKLCWKYGIPAREIGLEEHRKFLGRGGIMFDIRGAWPREYFFAALQDQLELYKSEGGL